MWHSYNYIYIIYIIYIYIYTHVQSDEVLYIVVPLNDCGFRCMTRVINK